MQPGYWIAKHSSLDSDVQESLRTSTLNHQCMHAKSLQSCLTLCDPMDCSPPGSSGHGDCPGKNTGVGCHALLQGIFPTQRLNPGLLHCRWITAGSEPPGKPKNTGVNSPTLLQGIFLTQESNPGLLHCKQILY